MKTIQPKKKESNILIIEAPKARMMRIAQRGSTHRSAKQYSRKDGKRVED